jgi:hypothetical protein
MTIQTLREFFLWCSAINYAILLLWWLLYTCGHGWMNRLLSRWGRLPIEQMDAIQFNGIIRYKLSIVLFNIVPFVALCMVRR